MIVRAAESSREREIISRRREAEKWKKKEEKKRCVPFAVWKLQPPCVHDSSWLATAVNWAF